MLDIITHLRSSDSDSVPYKVAVSNIAQLLHHSWIKQINIWSDRTIQSVVSCLKFNRGVMRHKLFIKKLHTYLLDRSLLLKMNRDQRLAFSNEAYRHLRTLGAPINAIEFEKGIMCEVPDLNHIQGEIDATIKEFGSLKVRCYAAYMPSQPLTLSNKLYLSVMSDDITIEDISFGTFEIRFNVPDYCGPLSYPEHPIVIAQSPNYPEVNVENPHPHVSNDTLCTGQGVTAVANTIKSGSLSQYFMLCNAVLRGYSKGDAYIPIEVWKGEYFQCDDCGAAVTELEPTVVIDSEQTYCDQCVWSCEGCGDFYSGITSRDSCSHDYQAFCPTCVEASKKMIDGDLCICGSTVKSSAA